MQLRTLYLINALGPGGFERHLLYLLGNLDRNRFVPHVLTLYDEPSYHVDDVRALNIPVSSLSHGDGWRGRAATILRYIGQMWRLRPQIVHSCMHYANLIARVARPFCPPHILLTAVQGVYLTSELRAERLTHWLDDGLIVNGPHLVQQIAGHIPRPPRKTHLIHNGISVERFASNTQPTLRHNLFPDAQFIVGLIGRITYLKDHPTLLKALHIVRSNWPAGLVVFFLGEVSEPPVQARIEDLITEYHLEGIVHQFPVTRDVVPYYYLADVTVLPSLLEGFPNVLLESFATGKPVIASTHADAVGIVQPGFTGWHFPTSDATALAHCLQEAWNTPAEQMKKMAEYARAEAARYSVPKMVERYTQLYESNIENRNRK